MAGGSPNTVTTPRGPGGAPVGGLALRKLAATGAGAPLSIGSARSTHSAGKALPPVRGGAGTPRSSLDTPRGAAGGEPRSGAFDTSGASPPEDGDGSSLSGESGSGMVAAYLEGGASRLPTGLSWFALWPVDRVRKAWERTVATGTWQATPRQFWDLFSDYETIIDDGTFLHLPPEAFNLFLETGGEKVVNVIEVLLVLSLFCRGTATQQLRLAFDMFDKDKSGSIEVEELISFFAALCSGCYKVGMIPTRPSFQEIVRVATDAFRSADADLGGDLSVQEFQMWARNNLMSKQLLQSFTAKRKQETKRTGQKTSIKSLAAMTTGKQPGSARLDPALQSALEQASQAFDACRLIVRKLQSTGTFDITVMADLQKKFAREAGKAKTLKIGPFKTLLARELPVLELEDGEKLFKAFDTDGSGDIDFKEFALGLGKMLPGSADEKLDLLFNVMTDGGSRGASLFDLTELLEQGSAETESRARMAENIVGELDKDQDGTISSKEFKDALARKPVLYEAFAMKDRGLDGLKAKVRDGMRKSGIRFDLPTLSSAWHRACKRSRGGMPENMTKEMFLEFMVTELKTPEHIVPACESVFDALDVDNMGDLDPVVVFKGLAQLTSSDPEKRAQFYFDLYDRDHSGDLSKDEILEILNSTQAVQTSAASTATKMLKKLDTDGNGSITLEEFKEASANHPDLLEAFANLFGIEEADPDAFRRRVPRSTSVLKASLQKLAPRSQGSDDAAGAPPSVRARAARREVMTMLGSESIATLGKMVEKLKAKEEVPGHEDEEDALSPTSAARRAMKQAKLSKAEAEEAAQQERVATAAAHRIASRAYLTKVAGSMRDVSRHMKKDVLDLVEDKNRDDPWEGARRAVSEIMRADGGGSRLSAGGRRKLQPMTGVIHAKQMSALARRATAGGTRPGSPVLTPVRSGKSGSPATDDVGRRKSMRRVRTMEPLRTSGPAHSPVKGLHRTASSRSSMRAVRTPRRTPQPRVSTAQRGRGRRAPQRPHLDMHSPVALPSSGPSIEFDRSQGAPRGRGDDEVVPSATEAWGSSSAARPHTSAGTARSDGARRLGDGSSLAAMPWFAAVATPSAPKHSARHHLALELGIAKQHAHLRPFNV